jgi:hypothetical protein
MKLIDKIKDRLERLDKALPGRRALLLPSDVFFCRTSQVPQAMKVEEIPGFIQLEIEAMAPFPIENLAWGYLLAQDGRAMTYAAMSERAFPDGKSEALWHALPSFVPFCLCEVPQKDIVRVCHAGGSLSAIWLRAGQLVPDKVLSRRMDASTPADALPAKRDAFLSSLGLAPDAAEPGVWTCAHIDSRAENRLSFTLHQVLPSAKPVERIVHMEGDTLWRADARGWPFATRERTSRRKDHLAWLALSGAGMAAALFVVAHLFLFLQGLWTGHLKRSAAEDAPLVATLQSKADFSANLESVSEREMKPFSMLAALNTGRPPQLYFERVTANAWNIMRIEGAAQRAEQVQSYVEALGTNPSVREVRNVRTTFSSGKTAFDMEVVFNQLEDLSDASKQARP